MTTDFTFSNTEIKVDFLRNSVRLAFNSANNPGLIVAVNLDDINYDTLSQFLAQLNEIKILIAKEKNV